MKEPKVGVRTNMIELRSSRVTGVGCSSSSIPVKRCCGNIQERERGGYIYIYIESLFPCKQATQKVGTFSFTVEFFFIYNPHIHNLTAKQNNFNCR